MNKEQEVSRREKGAAVGLVICFVAMIAIVGMITFSQYQRNTREQQLAEAETTENEQAKEKTNVEDERAQITNTDTIQAEIEKESVTETPEIVTETAPILESTLSFTANDALAWPLDGNVLMGYSMDKTVYFATLDQYKYNPAIIIGGEVGDEVVAAADGEVESIKVDAQTGTTITMNLGNGYQIVYGQLKEVSLQEGDRVSKGELIGYLSEPTKYYSVEGPNLYLQVLKDGEPVNPMEYMEA